MTDSPVEYSEWVDARTGFRLQYSLPVFHDIDFYVNEGFRRIPHGGIEMGGVLFGAVEANGARIDAYRPIDCEHALGPSFKLSESDIAKLRDQIASTADDSELSGLTAVGWFIAHTRTEIVMNDHEASVFDDVLPGPNKLTMLVKPERFKPTRFGVVVRGTDGRIDRDGTSDAFILPLPGRASKAVVEDVPPPPRPVFEPEAARPAPVPPPPPAPPRVERPAPAPLPIPPQPKPEQPTYTPPPIAPRAPEPEPASAAEPTFEQTVYSRPEPGPRSLRAHHFAWLLAACLLGCFTGFIAYTEWPQSVIPIRLEPSGSSVRVIWPASDTRNVENAVISVDGAQPVPLSSEEKQTGIKMITGTGSPSRVEIVAHHWWRDARGSCQLVVAK